MDDGFLDIKNLNFQSSRTLLFQRGSVMLSELVYFYGAYKLADSVQAYNSQSHTSERSARKSKGMDSLQFLIVANPGILFVDHIHFQYNSIMYGMQLLSIAAFFDGSFLLGGMWFAIVLNFKHIYLYQVFTCHRRDSLSNDYNCRLLLILCIFYLDTALPTKIPFPWSISLKLVPMTPRRLLKL